MGFFFTQHALEEKRNGQRKGLRNATANQQNIATLNRLGCAACPLNKTDVQTPKMQPTLGEKGGLYFLAEAPGRHEDESSGKPLTGPSGKLLRECIPDGEEQYCSFDNVVRDRPENNRTPTWQEIECCRNHVIKSIETVKPKLVVGLGGVPLTWALASTDLSGMRGRLFALRVGTHSFWFTPTYHPSFILRTAYDKGNPLRSKFGHCFKMDIRRAFDLLTDLPNAKVDTEIEARAGVQAFDGSGGYGDLQKLLKRASEAPIKAIDLETSRLRPYGADPRILTAAISFGDVNFSFALDHKDAKWRVNEYTGIRNSFGQLIRDKTTKIAHNAPFELEWLIHYYGKDIVRHDVWECTMMQAHFLDERRGKQGNDEDDAHRATYQSLDFLCKQHFGIPYKKLFKLDKKNMANSDLAETLTYNGVDTKYTLRLWHRQNKLLKKDGLLAAYKEALPRQPTVALMQHLGINVDQVEVKRSQKQLEKEIKILTTEMNELKVVKAYIRDNKEFNPLSDTDTLKIFRDYLKRPEVVVKTKGSFDFDKPSNTKNKLRNNPEEKVRYSTDKNVLAQIDHPLAEIIVLMRNRTKMKSTYVDCFELGVGESVWPDGKIHTSFNTTFAETGRTSSDEPNMQNFPKRNDAWVRRIIVPPKNHILLAFDYGQLEGCTAAMCSHDKVLIQALKDDYDIHMEWAQKLAARYPAVIGSLEKMKDKLVAKKFRSLVKNKLVFPAIYGAANESIAGYLDIPVEPIDDLMDEFWDTFRGLKNWQDRTMTNYYETGYISSHTGRWHRYPLTRNQVINFPIQGVAADIVCEAMNALSRYAVSSGQWHYHPRLNIHDDLTFVVPDSKEIIEKTIYNVKEVMLHPPYDFINVPLSVEVSQGNNWFEMHEIGKFWSNKH